MERTAQTNIRITLNACVYFHNCVDEHDAWLHVFMYVNVCVRLKGKKYVFS